MRVLVFCPTYPQQPLVRSVTLQALMSLDWPSCELVFSREDIPEPDRTQGHQNMFEKYVRARQIALDGGYDALLTVEADIVVPRDGLAKLAEVDAGVAYGLYCSRRSSYGYNWLLVQKPGSVYASPESLNPDFRQAAWGNVVESAGYGLGCTLIRREVLEQIPFRYPDQLVACDWYFAIDCQQTGIRQAHHCGVICGHVKGNETLWPDPETIYRSTIVGVH